MKKLSWAAMVLSATFALAAASAAKADTFTTVDLNTSCANSVCTSGGSMGTVTIDVVSSSEIKYIFNLTSGAIWDSGITTAFAKVTGTVGTVTVSGTNVPACVGAGCTSGSWGLGNTGTANFDGLGTGWNVYANCDNQKSVNCGTQVTLDVTGTGLGVGFVTVGGVQFFAGLDVSCNNPNPSGCTSSTVVKPGNTQAVGGTAAVPGPVLGAGLPGLIAACAGLAAFARRRRNRFA